ncbi:MAG: type III-B CRISPR module-associated protein Cmr5 [Herpetosiphonaceae bacterium]|nr:type III-B CRISPR module-associated protein Cmr5 [Herpetosiphonaceae bacterium]
MKTRDQRYAQSAWDRVSQVDQPLRDKYGAMAHQLPILILSAGLTQALAFVDSRKDAACDALLDDVAHTIGLSNRATLRSQSHTLSLQEYMWLTQQVLAALLWYKRFAESVMNVDTRKSGVLS